jgi:hypothetical protein
MLKTGMPMIRSRTQNKGKKTGIIQINATVLIPFPTKSRRLQQGLRIQLKNKLTDHGNDAHTQGHPALPHDNVHRSRRPTDKTELNFLSYFSPNYPISK